MGDLLKSLPSRARSPRELSGQWRSAFRLPRRLRVRAPAPVLLLCLLALAAGAQDLPRIHMHIFLSKDCPHCEPIEKKSLAKLSKKMGCKIVHVYHDLESMEEYKRLVILERRYKKTGNDLPVVIMGKHLLAGKEEIEKRLAPLVRDLAKAGGCEDVSLPTAADIAAAFPKVAGLMPVHLAYFEQPGCRECLRTDRMLEQFAREFKNLKVTCISRSQRRNRILLEVMGEKAGVPESRRLIVPAAFIGREGLVEKEMTDDPLRKLIEKYSVTGAPPRWNVSEAELNAAKERLVARFRAVGIGSVLLGGLIDGVNPCAFATLVFFIGYLATLGRKGKDILIVGGAFSVGVFATYLATGFGLSEVLLQVEFLPTVSVIVTWVIIVLTFILAALSFWDFLKALRGKHKEMTLKLPSSLRRYMNLLIARQLRTRNIAVAALLLGLAISLLELVCTGQVYLPLIQFMNSVSVDRARTLFLLIVYNLAFVLPLGVIFLAAYFGLGSEGLTAILLKNLAVTKLFMAVFFVALGTVLVMLS